MTVPEEQLQELIEESLISFHFMLLDQLRQSTEAEKTVIK
jgi:hypothetical protein